MPEQPVEIMESDFDEKELVRLAYQTVTLTPKKMKF